MKKVLISITSLFGGGAERVASFWANELVKHGYDVSILVMYRGKNEYSLVDEVKVYSVTKDFDEYLSTNKFETYRRLRHFIKLIMPETNICLLPRMQEWFYLATIGMKMKRIETVRVSPWVAVPNKKEEYLWKIVFNKADRVILQTQSQGDFFSKAVQNKCICISNPISDKFICNIRERNGPVRRFVAMGRVSEQKNYPMMIKAFVDAHNTHKDIKLDIYGIGEEIYFRSINELIASFNASDYIMLHGQTNQVPRVLLEADAFLMSSDYEGLPNALIEAMASGLVCISTKCPTGPEDLIKNGQNGFLVDVDDVEGLKEAINRVVILDSEQIKLIGAEAHKSILQKCDSSKIIKELINIIEE